MKGPSLDLRFLLHLYPRAWRARYGEELVDLAGSHVSWRVAMDIAESGIRERLNVDGYSLVRFAALLVRLTVVFVAFVSLSIGLKFVDFYFRFPGRSLSRELAGSFVRSLDIMSVGEMWLMYGLFAILIAVLVNGFGWRDRRPRLAAWLVRSGIFVSLLLIVASKELPPHFHASPYNLYAEVYTLIAAITVGFVVESAKLGRRLHEIAE